MKNIASKLRSIRHQTDQVHALQVTVHLVPRALIRVESRKSEIPPQKDVHLTKLPLYTLYSMYTHEKRIIHSLSYMANNRQYCTVSPTVVSSTGYIIQ